MAYKPYWRTKTFKTREAMEAYMERNPKNQYVEIIVQNGYGIEFKRLLIIG